MGPVLIRSSAKRLVVVSSWAGNLPLLVSDNGSKVGYGRKPSLGKMLWELLLYLWSWQNAIDSVLETILVAAIYDLKSWLDQGNAPESSEDAADLEQAILGRSQGRYRFQTKQDGEFLLVTGPGKEAFMFKRATLDNQIAELRSIYQSEPGASLQGDAAYERGMLKDD